MTATDRLGTEERAQEPTENRNWTGALRRRLLRELPPDRLLPDSQPAYMASWIYLFGVLTVAALGVVIATGCLLALRGPAWWHLSSVGHYVNSMHLWSVELFLAFMVIHLWGKFFMAAWRGKRAMTWMTGAVAFFASIGTAFTGYLAQTNLDSQWISTQAKDGLNSVGIGAWFNVMDFGQMLMWHIVLLPAVIGLLTVWHLVLVRRRGIVPPIGAVIPGAEAAPGTATPDAEASDVETQTEMETKEVRP